MPPKEKASKKAVVKKMEGRIEDATFGLKNKNKSSKVKQFVDRAVKSAKNSAGAADAAKAKEAKKELKLAKQLQEEELRLLFNEGITGQFGKKKSAAQEKAKEMGLSETAKEVQELLDAMSDEDEDDEVREKRQTIYLEDEAPVVEVFREKTLEDIIEEQRAKLAAQGKVGTPVTEESFRSWRALKLAQRQAEAEARYKAEQAKKKGAKGLSSLSGKELFSFNASLFVDDEHGLDAAEEEKLNAQTRLAAEEEEARQVFEAERARAEQKRLEEERRLEEEERDRQQEVRRQVAALKKEVFQLGAVCINAAVFDVEEYEDLIPFLDEDEYELVDVEDDDEEDDDEEGEEGEEGDHEEEGEDDELLLTDSADEAIDT